MLIRINIHGENVDTIRPNTFLKAASKINKLTLIGSIQHNIVVTVKCNSNETLLKQYFIKSIKQLYHLYKTLTGSHFDTLAAF